MAGYCKMTESDYEDLFSLLKRLYGVTGFVSVLGDDERTSIFKRYYHTERVVQVSNLLLEKNERSKADVLFLAYFHDINRLPFAHNLEMHIKYNQSENIKKYFDVNNIVLSEECIRSFENIASKSVVKNADSALVLNADAIVGYYEDILLATTTLGLDINSISKTALDMLLIKPVEFNKEIRMLKFMYDSAFVSKYTHELGRMVSKYSEKFIDEYCNNKLLIEEDSYKDFDDTIKIGVLRDMIYPINNEEVSQGSLLSREVFTHYISYLEDKNIDVICHVMNMTDQELMNDAVNFGIITESSKYNPKLK